MFRTGVSVFLVLSAVFFSCSCQEYDFAAEITRQCLVPDPVGLLDCVENKVTLPYLTSWVDCTNSLGENVRTSADIINYRCKSVWEGKGVIPEVFFIKDCVIEKTGLPAKNVSAEVLGAYKECESTPNTQQQRVKTAPVQQQQRIKTAPVQQQQLRASTVEYRPPSQQIQAPVVRPPQQPIQVRAPIQQVQAPVFQPPQQRVQVQPPFQQVQAPVFQSPQQRVQVQPSFQQFQAPVFQPPQQRVQVQQTFQQVQVPVFQPPQQRVQVQPPYQQVQAPISFQTQNVAPRQQFTSPAARPVQQQISVAAPRPVQQAPVRSFVSAQVPARPAQLTQQVPVASRPQFQIPNSGPQYSVNPASQQRQPYSQQFFVIYPQAPLPNQQQNVRPLSQKTVPNPAFVTQQQVSASNQQSSSINPNAPYSYSFQINHPLQQAF